MFGGVVERLSDPAACPIRSMTKLRIEGGVELPYHPFFPSYEQFQPTEKHRGFVVLAVEFEAEAMVRT